MSKTVKGYSASPKAVERRKKVIQRLELQISSKTKPALVHEEGTGGSTWQLIPLEEYDYNRINKELSILKTRI